MIQWARELVNAAGASRMQVAALLQVMQIGGDAAANAFANVQNGVRLALQIVGYRIGMLLRWTDGSCQSCL